MSSTVVTALLVFGGVWLANKFGVKIQLPTTPANPAPTPAPSPAPSPVNIEAIIRAILAEVLPKILQDHGLKQSDAKPEIVPNPDGTFTVKVPAK